MGLRGLPASGDLARCLAWTGDLGALERLVEVLVKAGPLEGDLLLQAGRVGAAEEVYRQDLKRHPGNGWSLHGLAECLRRQGRAAEADQAQARFRAAWARADVILPGSCFCRTAD